ncbi:thiaminase II [Paludifilum halophilum]|uniref:Aminopyrimidine aminohydrolase n=1 Tax=Paludifilum halophilum TaxID=1642702 RepID=A0A235BD86_9BACL|nr:thiaminase II [Paludifilum halophilum]OYD09907.1 thiaminase II [Paludifilum halophilum]
MNQPETVKDRLSERLRREADIAWQKSFEHPFILGVAQGSLPLDSFIFYLGQDAYYLSVFAKVQSLAGAKSETFAETKRWAEHVQKTYEVEKALHDRFSQRLNLAEAQKRFQPAPTAFAYTRHLLAIAHTGSLIEIVSALLPCYWLYREIGQRLAKARPGVEVYEEWIEAYASPEFGQLVQEQIDTLDTLAATSSEKTLQRVHNHFLISSQYEYLFWEMAYRRETWPFPDILGTHE